MLTAGPLFPGVTESRLIGQAHVDRRPTPLHERAPQVPREIADIVMQALDKDPKARPKDAHAFRQPFSTIRNRLLREQAQSAGFSTIERFLANTVGAERVPVVVSSDPVKGSTLRLPALRPEVRDTTAPSDPPYGGTQPDRGDVLVRQRDASALSGALITRPDRPARPVLQGQPMVVVDDSPSSSTEAALREEQILWKAPSGLAALPMQPPVIQHGTPGTDPTSARDLAPRPTQGESSGVAREKDEPQARRRSLARRAAGVAVGIALVIGVVDVAILFTHAKRAAVSAGAVTAPSAIAATAVPVLPVDAPVLARPAPAPLPSATPAPAPLPSATSATSAVEASASASAAPAPPATRKEKEKKAGGHAGHAAAASTESSPSGVDLFEDIAESHAPRPAPSASARPKSKVPGADF